MGNIPPVFLPGIEDLLPEIQGPVERWRVVVDELRVRDDGLDAVHHAGDLFDVGLLGFNPKQVRAIVERIDAVHNATVRSSAFPELEEI
ncbi:hypothetical protein D9M72_531570 [compost metagenome]